jgi:hypothetical protein
MDKIPPTNSLEGQARVQEVSILDLAPAVNGKSSVALLPCSLGQCRRLPCQPSRHQQQYRLLVDLLRLRAPQRHHNLPRQRHLGSRLRRRTVLLQPTPSPSSPNNPSTPPSSPSTPAAWSSLASYRTSICRATRSPCIRGVIRP